MGRSDLIISGFVFDIIDDVLTQSEIQFDEEIRKILILLSAYRIR